MREEDNKIVKYTIMSFTNIMKTKNGRRVSGINGRAAHSLGDDLTNCENTIKEQFGDYCDIDGSYKMDMEKFDKRFFQLVFTLYFTREKLNLLKLKEPYLYNLLEDEIYE